MSAVLGAVSAAVGKPVLLITVIERVAVQPLVASVAVTVYIPGRLAVAGFTFGAVVKPGPAQTQASPPIAKRSVVKVSQVSVRAAGIDTTGCVVFLVMITFAEAVQPLPAVTVTK